MDVGLKEDCVVFVRFAVRQFDSFNVSTFVGTSHGYDFDKIGILFLKRFQPSVNL